MRTSSKLRRRVSATVLAALLAGLGCLAVISPAPASAASTCAALTKSVHLFVNARLGVSALTYDSRRFSALKKAGYADLGVLFRASAKRSGMSAVHELYNSKTSDRIYTKSAKEMAGIKKKGYADRGVAFYAYASKSSSCLSPAYRFIKGPVHRIVSTAADRAALQKMGWRQQGVVYWLAEPASLIKVAAPSRPAGQNPFTIAVLPDTQQEVLKAGDPRFAGRTDWLVAHRSSLELAYVTHVGDIVNWDTPDHAQYKVAAAGLQKLNDAHIPYSLVPGNHDTAAVCPGGSACDPPKSPQLIRDTRSYNAYLNHGTADLAGRFEAGKLDNTYSVFRAGQRNWLVLNLEIYPRVAVVNWARTVVATHPGDNVIVVTHSYLTSGGAIGTNREYGATTPKYLYDNLISRYANIRLVFSGHVGTNAHRVDTGVHKNRIDSFLLCMHSNTTNPVRLVQIDTWQGTLKTWVYAPYHNVSYPGYTVSLSHLSYVR